MPLFQHRNSQRLQKKSSEADPEPAAEVMDEAESRLIEDFDEPISRYQGKNFDGPSSEKYVALRLQACEYRPNLQEL